MIIRFVAKNIFSFKEETEFNLLPNKTQRLSHHKINIGEFDFLRFSAIYGANGAGKSNLIKAITLLDSFVEKGKIVNGANNLKFKLDKESSNIPISLAIEFYFNSKVYYYTITFDENVILHEYLAESHKKNDILVFERVVENGIQKIQFFEGYDNDKKNKLFVEVLEEKLISQKELLLTFLSKKYPDEFRDVKNVYDWFDTMLVIISPEAKPGGIAHILDIDVKIKEFANKLIPSLNTGISKIEIEKKKAEEFVSKNDIKVLKEITDDLKNEPNAISVFNNQETGDEVCFTIEDGEVITKRLVTNHINNEGNKVPFTLGEESDGTRRLIDYIPALEGVIDANRVYLIDEIERSIHPITIKEIIKKLSLDENVKGQLIFTTHESNLLDQEILRPDEIWFAQKDIDGASKLYSLSDFKIHNTIDIENGYLNGRYGGIPFLSNLKDLNWE
ncbi:MAG: ATP-binding protein [Candidatus Symbiothrix sp.]|jgi:AAA15 family ATPase/GTPase|nr:ATP-binding protein [Candidatus Symbiothrix sp.]